MDHDPLNPLNPHNPDESSSFPPVWRLSPGMEPPHPNAFISSTLLDLPAHRKAAIDYTWRCGFYPLAMEKDSASSVDAVTYSLRLADVADVYIGVFGFRYGTIKPPHDCSITELEVRRAIQRGIPLLLFYMHDDHPVRHADIELDSARREKLQALKQELRSHATPVYFTSVDQLGHLVFAALANLRLELLQRVAPPAATAATTAAGRRGDPAASSPAHADASPHRPDASVIPPAPQPYEAHPYILGHRFIGRERELAQLDAWACERADPMLIVESIGGEGKSALTWRWFQERAPHVRPEFAGRMWWSFYETDATVTNFVRHALAYVSGEPLDSVDKRWRTPIEREQALLAAVRARPYLIVLDGLERILVAYNRHDAPHLRDDQVTHVDQTTQADQVDQSEQAHRVQEARLRRCASPGDGRFLTQLTRCVPSKLLLSSRLLPRDLCDQRDGDLPLPGVQRLPLTGLTADDAMRLWRTLGVEHGDRVSVATFIEQVGRHALLLEVLAGRITHYRSAPGDFNEWYSDEGARLRLSELDLVQRRTHVLAYALDGLTAEQRALLAQIAVFRYPVEYSALAALNPYLPPKQPPHLPPAPPAPKYDRTPFFPRLPATPSSQQVSRVINALEREIRMLRSDRDDMRARLRDASSQDDGSRKPNVADKQRPKRNRPFFGHLFGDRDVPLTPVSNETATPEELESLERQLTECERQLTTWRQYQHAVQAAEAAAEKEYEVASRPAQASLHRTLSELEERGLLHWDRPANRYDLHPVVRASAFEQLEDATRNQAYLRARDHFQGLPPEDLDAVRDVADLRRTIEIYHAMVGAVLRDAAFSLYGERLHTPLDALAAYPTMKELLTPLFQDGRFDALPLLSDPESQSRCLTEMGNLLTCLGETSLAVAVYTSALHFNLDMDRASYVRVTLGNLIGGFTMDGKLALAERVLALMRELAVALDDAQGLAISHLRQLDCAMIRGQWLEVEAAYQAFTTHPPLDDKALWLADAESAHGLAQRLQGQANVAEATLTRAWTLAVESHSMRVQQAIRWQRAELALLRRQFDEAEHLLQQHLDQARKSGQQVSNDLVMLAKIAALCGRTAEARHLLVQAREEAVTPDALPHSRVAEVALALGDREQALEEALLTYQENWCDGPPYVAWDPLQRARAVLAALGEPEPSLPPFDPSRVAPVPYEDAIRAMIDQAHAKRSKRKQ